MNINKGKQRRKREQGEMPTARPSFTTFITESNCTKFFKISTKGNFDSCFLLYYLYYNCILVAISRSF